MHKPARNLGLGFSSPTLVWSCQVSYIGFWYLRFLLLGPTLEATILSFLQ
jgi:hypothetical protein